jgi:cyclophilin family peptidyl-prolyl cis-trans isomerase
MRTFHIFSILNKVMKKLRKPKILFFLAITCFWSLNTALAQSPGTYADSAKTALVEIYTQYGTLKIRLFNQTPLHRDNFIKLAEQGFYDSLLFHRVINGFMIQGGDPDSKNAKPGQLLGDGEVKGGEWIPAEFRKDLFHKRGVLAAARESDDKNPEKKSSSCQFYITQGRGPLSDRDLKLYEYRINKKLRNAIKDSLLALPENKELAKKYEQFKKERQNDSLTVLDKNLDQLIESIYEKAPHYTFSEEQIKAYKSVGGTPHLDGNYTVYGEVLYGMDVVDKIAGVDTDKNDRPVNDIRMQIKVVRKPKL